MIQEPSRRTLRMSTLRKNCTLLMENVFHKEGKKIWKFPDCPFLPQQSDDGLHQPSLPHSAARLELQDEPQSSHPQWSQHPRGARGKRDPLHPIHATRLELQDETQSSHPQQRHYERCQLCHSTRWRHHTISAMWIYLAGHKAFTNDQGEDLKP